MWRVQLKGYTVTCCCNICSRKLITTVAASWTDMIWSRSARINISYFSRTRGRVGIHFFTTDYRRGRSQHSSSWTLVLKFDWRHWLAFLWWGFSCAYNRLLLKSYESCCCFTWLSGFGSQCLWYSREKLRPTIIRRWRSVMKLDISHSNNSKFTT